MILNAIESSNLYHLVKYEHENLDGFKVYTSLVPTCYIGDFGKGVRVRVEEEMVVEVLGRDVDTYIDGPWWDYLREQIPLLQAKADEVKHISAERQKEAEEKRRQRKLEEHEELAKRFKEVMK